MQDPQVPLEFSWPSCLELAAHSWSIQPLGPIMVDRSGSSATLRTHMSSHRAVHVQSTGGPLQLVDADTPSRGRDQVRIAVSACGPCGTYRAFVNGGLPAMSWPLTPGHEIAGAIAEIGDGVQVFTVGDRVAVGWSGGHCTKCIPCRKGLFIHCENGQVRSWHYPGGYAESVTVPRLC